MTGVRHFGERARAIEVVLGRLDRLLIAETYKLAAGKWRCLLVMLPLWRT
jgi:hypothetical protein